MKRKQSTTFLTESMHSDMSTMEWVAAPDSTASTPDTPHQAERNAQFHTYYSQSDIIDADVWDQLLDVLKVSTKPFNPPLPPPPPLSLSFMGEREKRRLI